MTFSGDKFAPMPSGATMRTVIANGHAPHRHTSGTVSARTTTRAEAQRSTSSPYELIRTNLPGSNGNVGFWSFLEMSGPFDL